MFPFAWKPYRNTSGTCSILQPLLTGVNNDCCLNDAVIQASWTNERLLDFSLRVAPAVVWIQVWQYLVLLSTGLYQFYIIYHLLKQTHVRDMESRPERYYTDTLGNIYQCSDRRNKLCITFYGPCVLAPKFTALLAFEAHSSTEHLHKRLNEVCF